TAMVLGWYASNCSEALIGAGLTRVFIPEPLRLTSLRNSAIFLLGVVLAAPLFSSFIDAALVHLAGFGDTPYWELVNRRFFSNVLAELTVVPLILTWAALIGAGRTRMPPARMLAAGVLAVALLGACFLVFEVPLGAGHRPPALFYAPLPFLLWAAVRLCPVGTATALPVMTLAAIWGTVHGLGPFVSDQPHDTARDVQLFVIAVSVPLLLFAIAIEERERLAR